MAQEGQPPADLNSFKKVLQRLTEFNRTHAGNTDISPITRGLNGHLTQLKRTKERLQQMLQQLGQEILKLNQGNLERGRAELQRLTGDMARELNAINAMIPEPDDGEGVPPAAPGDGAAAAAPPAAPAAPGARRGGYQYKKSKSRHNKNMSKLKHTRRRSRHSKSKSKSKHSRRRSN